MNLYLITGCFLSKENLQRPAVNYLRNNACNNMNTKILQERDISWEKSNNYKNIVKKYFYNYDLKNIFNKYKNLYDNSCGDLYENSYAELLKIHGIPAVAIIINNNNNNVIDFIINKNLILMFDAGSLCRYSFYKNYKNYCIKNALHKDDFLII
tara:strand:- start:12341 stop:12802 length:462 start_codon:yes stop_codon:yes gene_type:complete